MATRKKAAATNGHAHPPVHTAGTPISTRPANIKRMEQRELTCKLSGSELIERGNQLAEHELEVERVKEQRKGLNGQIADMRAEIGKLSVVVEQTAESRMVECGWVEDEHAKSWKLYRLDTNQLIDQRAMSADELQKPLSFDEQPAPAAPEPAKRARKKGGTSKRHAHESTAN